MESFQTLGSELYRCDSHGMVPCCLSEGRSLSLNSSSCLSSVKDTGHFFGAHSVLPSLSAAASLRSVSLYVGWLMRDDTKEPMQSYRLGVI